MSSKTIQIIGETLDESDIKSMCSILQRDLLKILSLRDCEISENDFKKIMKSVTKCKSLVQLALNIKIINNDLRIRLLTPALAKNKSITGLFIHGSTLGDDGIKILSKSIIKNGRLQTLDIGDCHLGDSAISYLCDLVTPTSEWSGLLDLSLSANTEITHSGWSQFSLAVAASNLRSLYLDYNLLGDSAAFCIVVAVAGCGSLEILDLEGTGVTQKTAMLVLNLVENYSVRLRKVSFSGNKVQKATVEAIKFNLNVSNDDETDGSDADLLSVTSRSSFAEPKHAEIKVLTSSGDTESGNETDRTMQDYSLHSEIIEQAELKMSMTSLSVQKHGDTTNAEKVNEFEDIGEELKEVPAYYTGIPVTF